MDQGVGGGPKFSWHLALFAHRAAVSFSTPQTGVVTIGSQPEEGAPWQEGVGEDVLTYGYSCSSPLTRSLFKFETIVEESQ